MRNHVIVDRLRRLAIRREQEGIYTDANLVNDAADRMEMMMNKPIGTPISWWHILLVFLMGVGFWTLAGFGLFLMLTERL